MDRAMELWNRIRQSELGRGLMISVSLHGLLVIALLVTIPWPHAEPEQPVVEVTLVDPPKPTEEQPPEEKPQQPEQPAAEAPKPEEPARPEPEVAAEPKAMAPSVQEPPPAPEPPQPAPEPPPAQLQEPAPEPPQDPEPEAPSVEEPSAAEAQAGQGQQAPIPTLKPVFQFGEKDAGSRLAPDGNATQEPGQAADPPEETPAPVETASETSDTTGQQPQAEPAVPTPSIALPEITLPEAALATADPENLLEAADRTQLSAIAPLEPKPDAAAAPASAPSKKPEDLAEAKKLFSTVVSGDPVAMAAAGNLPREVRASELCTTELREQLRNAKPAYRPELLPAYQLKSGNVLEVPNAAFRASGKWYSLHFRCTVDDDAMKVAGFAMKVGAAIPRSQWKARGFPDF